tara:strand:- start:158 stop:583 length:426 start_codon:yes stop_codon:yes gene_type:complete
LDAFVIFLFFVEAMHSFVFVFFSFLKQATDLIAFYTKFHKQKWKRHKSQKICEIAFGRLQGKNELISQFRERNNRVTIPKDYQPICFHVSGAKKGSIEHEAFAFASHNKNNKHGAPVASPTVVATAMDGATEDTTKTSGEQ